MGCPWERLQLPHALEADPAACAALDQGLFEVLAWRGHPVDTVQAALRLRPDFVMGHLFVALLHALGSFPANAPQVMHPLAQAERAFAARRAGLAADWEDGHLRGAQLWIAGDFLAAADAWHALLARWPQDLFAAKLLHDACLFTGDARRLEAEMALVRDHWERERASHLGLPFVQGMHAFGLEEAGRHDEALRAGLRAVERQPRDAWAVHAVAHVHEMQCRPAEGLAWLAERSNDWTGAGALAHHLHWHSALYLLEQERPAEALAVYDARLRAASEAASASTFELVDATSLLLRCELGGADPLDLGERWERLADRWAPHVGAPRTLAFNDLHMMMAVTGAGRLELADKLLVALEAHAAQAAAQPRLHQALVVRDVALPLARAVVDWRAGHSASAVALLAPQLQPEQLCAARIGGSYAQRDVFEVLRLRAAEQAHHPAGAQWAWRRAEQRGRSPAMWRLCSRVLANLSADALAACNDLHRPQQPA